MKHEEQQLHNIPLCFNTILFFCNLNSHSLARWR